MGSLAVLALAVLAVVLVGGAVTAFVASARRRALNPVIATARVRSTGTVVVPLPAQHAAQAVRAAMHAIGARETQPVHSHLQAQTSPSFWSWGERILVHLAPGPHGTSVSARSEPLLPTTLVDLGQGQRNVELLLRAVHDLAHGRRP